MEMEHQEQYNLGNQIATIKAEVSNISKSLDELKAGMWRRVENLEQEHRSRIPVLEDRVNDIRKFLWFIISCFGVQIIGAITYMIFKKP